jgi:hypothetical protein
MMMLVVGMPIIVAFVRVMPPIPIVTVIIMVVMVNGRGDIISTVISGRVGRVNTSISAAIGNWSNAPPHRQ